MGFGSLIAKLEVKPTDDEFEAWRQHDGETKTSILFRMTSVHMDGSHSTHTGGPVAYRCPPGRLAARSSGLVLQLDKPAVSSRLDA